MVSKCASLVIVDGESDIIRLVYYITQEYFERMQIPWHPDVQTDITRACFTHLRACVAHLSFDDLVAS